MLKRDHVYQNKKTGNYYYILGFGYDSDDEGPKDERDIFVIYKRTDQKIPDIWIREIEQFREKFEPFCVGSEHIKQSEVFVEDQL